jgi:hypothetical protein
MKWFTILWGLYMVVWAALEGGLRTTVFAAIWTAILIIGYLFNRFLAGRTLSTGSWLLVSAVLGALIGMGSGLLTLVLMAIKTGLHAHGPEYSAAELNWALQQLPLWTLAGLLAGLGLGLLLKAVLTQMD